jgi:hypothetical protein
MNPNYPTKDNSNSNSNSKSNSNSSQQDSGGGGQAPVLNGSPNMDILNAMDQQLVAIEEGQFRAVQVAFAQQQITEKMAKLLSTQALFNKYIQDPTIGKVDINGVTKTMEQLKTDIENQRSMLINAIDTIQQGQAEDDESRSKRAALNRLVIQSQNRIPVEDAAAYITYIFERMSKKQDFDPVITKRICDEIVKKFEEEMRQQGQVGLLQQYSDWIKSYIDEALTKATISYLKAKALAEPAGQAAAGLTMIGLAATNVIPRLEYLTSVSQGLGPAIMNDNLMTTMATNVGRQISNATTNILIASTNLVTSAIASHPVAATFGGLALLISAYWKLSPEHKRLVSAKMNELFEKLQIIWNGATDPNTWIPAYHKVNALMAEMKDFFEDRGIYIVDEDYDSELSVRSASSASSRASSIVPSRASSSASSGVEPLTKPSYSTVSSKTTVSSKATVLSKASEDADSLSLDLFAGTGNQLAEEKLKRFQDIVNNNDPDSSSSRSSSIPREVIARAESDISDITNYSYGSKSPANSGQSSPYSTDYNRGGVNSPGGMYFPVSQVSRANSINSQDLLIPNSRGSTPRGSPMGQSVSPIQQQLGSPINQQLANPVNQQLGSPILGQKRTTTADEESNKRGRSEYSSSEEKMNGGRRKSRRYKSRRYTKKRPYRKYRNTRRRPKRHTKKRGRK